MRVEIIDNINHFPQFEAQNVFQTKEWMHLFEKEDDTKVVIFAVYANAQLDAIRNMENPQLLLLQPVTIQRFVKWLPWRVGAHAVAWREPWKAKNITDKEAQQLFEVLQKAINQYCRRKAIYIEYRHFSENNIYHLIFNAQRSTLKLPWFNIYQKFNAGESVDVEMNKSKRKQLRQSFEAGVNIELNPNDDEIREWYVLLQKLYRRIHRPLPSLQVFLKLNNSGIGKVFVVKYQNKVISGSAILYLLSKEKNSQLFYDWYRASIKEPIEGVYPSVVSTWQAMQLVAKMGGGTFDVMGAGPRNKPYGVRNFKLTFGGELTPEYRYRKWL